MMIIKNSRKIEDYQLQELKDNKLFINKYDLSLKYDYELRPMWESFFFNIIQELKSKTSYTIYEDNLFDYYKKNWYNIIRKYKLNVDINDYIDLVDYISLQQWEKISNHCLIYAKNFFLAEVQFK